ncbi:glycoside hydrolase family 3 C-terminal domain-containing protein [Cellulomonas sp. McL0617]|uniref:glycoside hydrolase family 3 C-terminal domain-containing protein n=1 Tax=Cellulomonas sp. McL0617 TaxID=3415675 RepID=UPI003CF72397
MTLHLDAPELAHLLSRLTLERKVLLLTGRDFWSTHPLDEIGLRSMVLSDGPAGVRGPTWDERETSLSLPSGTALASSWDPEIARTYGRVMAQEARRKDVDVVLGPTINLHRSPLGGRHFEAFSEDPLLTGDLGAAYVDGMQAEGVAACPKHYVANDFETERMSASVEVSERALRELYLAAFEKAVVSARAWSLMSAYNGVNGTPSSESELLQSPLKTEWGFDGVVLSDWGGVYSLAAAGGAQDLVMPGPVGPWGDELVKAVRDGRVPESTIDDKVVRLLLLAARVGALDGYVRAVGTDVVDGPAFARRAAAEGTVLLSNDGVLPVKPTRLKRVVVVGQSARLARSQGGGSATVIPERVVSPLDGIRAALPTVSVDYSLGAILDESIIPLPIDEITHPTTGEAGSLVRFLDADGVEILREDRRATEFFYFGGTAPTASAAMFEVSFRWEPERDVDALLSYTTGGSSRLLVNGSDVAALDVAEVGLTFEQALAAPPTVSVPVTLTAGDGIDVRIEVDLRSRPVTAATAALFMLKAGTQPAPYDRDALIAEAAREVMHADLAVVVVGTSGSHESEGFDRTTLELPGEQNALVEAVLATGTPTVVIVNAGAPVILPWRDRAAAVMLTYFGGQEMGHAIGDILTGVVEPGGRLPTTWPAAQSDVPILDVTPVDGRLAYAEGVFIGYRAWSNADHEPAYPFGHGLGYTSWQVDDLAMLGAVGAHGEVYVAASVTNTGGRPGKNVVQVYASCHDDSAVRPDRWLVGYAVVRLDAGERTDVEIEVAERAFSVWSEDGWVAVAGTYRLSVGSSVDDLVRSCDVAVAPTGEIEVAVGDRVAR